MSDHYFKFTPIDRLNNFNRYVKFDKFNKIDKFDRFEKFFWYNKFCWFDKSDKFDKVDILENLKDMTSFTVLNKRSYCIIGWDKNFKIYTGKYEKKGSFMLYLTLRGFMKKGTLLASSYALFVRGKIVFSVGGLSVTST